MQIYFIESMNPIHTLSWRTCSYHSSIFHGLLSRPETRRTKIQPPSITNQNRESPHVRRSGRYVPKIWMASLSLIVAECVKGPLARLPNTAFLPVAFDQLIDIPMPSLGDFSWFERITTPPGPEPEHELEAGLDVPAFHQSIGHYWEVLSANLYELDSKPADAKRVKINFGSYAGVPAKSALVSPSLLKKYPFVWSDIFQIREDAFAIVAPFIDLDFFNIARHYIDSDEE